MKKQITQDEETKAAALAHAAHLYTELADIAATVTVESNDARVRAIAKAGELVSTGVSLRKAAEAAGRKADTSLDRFCLIARTVDAKEVKAPAPYKTWADAIAHSSLRSMVKHIRDTKGRKVRKAVSVDERAKRIIFANLRNLQSLTLRAKTAKRKGIIVNAESLNQIITAWLDAGMPVEALELAKLPAPVMVGSKPKATDGTPVGDALNAVQDALGQTAGEQVQRATA